MGERGEGGGGMEGPQRRGRGRIAFRDEGEAFRDEGEAFRNAGVGCR